MELLRALRRESTPHSQQPICSANAINTYVTGITLMFSHEGTTVWQNSVRYSTAIVCTLNFKTLLHSVYPALVWNCYSEIANVWHININLDFNIVCECNLVGTHYNFVDCFFRLVWIIYLKNQISTRNRL